MAKKRGAYKKDGLNMLVDVFSKKVCNISATCSALNISRRTFYDWMEQYPELKEQIEDAKEGLVDFAETQLVSKINDGDLNAITFFLRAKGKERGYGESKKIEFDNLSGERIVYVSKEEEKATQEHIEKMIKDSKEIK